VTTESVNTRHGGLRGTRDDGEKKGVGKIGTCDTADNGRYGCPWWKE